jgi:response regulator RpfG family c-di-GMP phosphodiesterase
MRKTILHIDDSLLELALVTKALGNDFEVISASSGYAALEILGEGLVPDLFLLDILMPVMDGWGVFHKIRGMNLMSNIPIVFFTSVEDASSEKRAYELHARDYIRKGIKRNELLKRIKEILE